ncbi:FkbM family methyltransferase [Rhodobacteraceae bacterium B1Z28]|uniref:FkbM family methyltransferase n=1 Tax=Ruegeria haliotis TaxID=2747601 RepID=A0ABX2PLP1_9RHOB|nr:FkbM family methyltransferase [Ruegeria haliotis]NVO55032.1 FkbM family methyltransferase [Ruegeria haliotis]
MIILDWISRRLKKREAKYFGLNSLDQKLEPYVDFDNGFFVELGANDGITQSNSYYFEKARNWNGILIEPAPHNFLKCFARRGKTSRVFCNACVEFGFPDKLVELTYANLMSISVGLDLDLADKDQHLRDAQQHMKETEVSFSFGAVAKPLNEILIDGEAPDQINFLSLDVEGAELNVLKGIDHDRFRFDYMLIECRSFDRLNDYLQSVGYKFETSLSQHDYLFKDIRDRLSL